MMKKFFAFTAACALALSIGGTASAGCAKAGGGCADCAQSAQGAQLNQVNPASATAGMPDPYRQFKQKTLDLRQEMMNKRFELQRENLKATADAGKVAGLKSDIQAIQVRINEIRVQSGLPDNGKRDGECFKMDGSCFKQDGRGNCSGQPCWQKKP
jgi:hypothetical protein